MKMEAGKTPKGKKTKERIIKASLKLINIKGIEKVTLGDICKEAEIAQGTFYHYFKSLDEILIEIIRQEGEELGMLYHHLENLPSREKLKQVLSFLFDYYDSKGREIVAQLYKLELKSQQNRSVIEENLPIRPLISKIIDEGQKSGEFSPADSPNHISEIIISLIMFSSILWIKDPSRQSFREVVESRIDREIKKIIFSQP